MFGAMRLADALSTPILFRHERGRVAFLNHAAKRELGLEPIVDFELALTIIRRGVDKHPNRNVYLLSAEMEPIARLVAEPAKLEIPGFNDVELITLTPTPGHSETAGTSTRIETRQTVSEDSVPAGTANAAESRRSDMTAFSPRDLLACATRRLRRHFSGALRVEVGAVPRKTEQRGLTVDEIALAEVVLSAASWLISTLRPSELMISAVTAGPRLRLVLERDINELEAPQQPLDVDRDWPRRMRPFLDAHRATFEIHDERRHRRIAITLPMLALAPARR